MKVRVKEGQTLADIVVQQYGTLEALGDVARANDLAMSAELAAGTEIECPEKTYNKYLAYYAKNKQISPATAKGYGTNDSRD